jgi:carbon-monoxide dehydrogenase medium subunit
MKTWNTYYLAQDVPDALKVLAADAGPVRIVAGGTDLLLDLQQGRHAPVNTLIDVTAIPAMTALEIRQGRLFVGACVPLNQVVAHPLVQDHAAALFEAGSLIGGPQVRNSATLGGNVAHALPAADGTISLVALDAQAEVATLAGISERPLLSLFAGPGKSALEPRRELLTGFYLPLRQAGEASAFQRIMRPQGVAIAILNMAVWLRREGARIAAIRIAIGPSGPVPQRALAAEEVLRGAAPTTPTWQAAHRAITDTLKFRTSPHRATAEYRRHMSGVLLHDLLLTTWERSGGDPQLLDLGR